VQRHLQTVSDRVSVSAAHFFRLSTLYRSEYNTKAVSGTVLSCETVKSHDPLSCAHVDSNGWSNVDLKDHGQARPGTTRERVGQERHREEYPYANDSGRERHQWNVEEKAMCPRQAKSEENVEDPPYPLFNEVRRGKGKAAVASAARRRELQSVTMPTIAAMNSAARPSLCRILATGPRGSEHLPRTLSPFEFPRVFATFATPPFFEDVPRNLVANASF
jgi:hypothetical protein